MMFKIGDLLEPRGGGIKILVYNKNTCDWEQVSQGTPAMYLGRTRIDWALLMINGEQRESMPEDWLIMGEK